MSNLDRIVNIIGTALVLGLLLRWGPEAARLIGATGAATSELFRAVSLQGIRSPSEGIAYTAPAG